VHIVTFHNEALIALYEREVLSLIEKLDRLGLRGATFKSLQKRKIESALDDFLKYRLTAFHDVRKHLHFNMFRYDTERQFFDEIERVRGTNPRRDHWEDVLKRLEETVQDIRNKLRQESDDRQSSLLVLVAFFSIFQVLFLVSESFRKFFARTSESPPLVRDMQHVLLPDLLDVAFILLLIPLIIVTIGYAFTLRRSK
jgi:hypothetical protein